MSSRHEEQSSTKVTRNKNSTLNKSSELNNNLDNLLSELKTTVTRTAEHLDAANASNASKSSEVQCLSPSNKTTVVEERSSSPAGENRKTYKSSHYEYTSSNGNAPQSKIYQSGQPSNINDLDNLLDELKQTPKFTAEKDSGIDSGLLEPNSQTTKTTTRTVTTSADTSKPFNRKLNSPTLVRKIMNQSSRSNSPSFPEKVETTREVKFDTSPLKDSTPNSTTGQRTYNYSKTSSSSRNVPYNSDIVEIGTSDLPAELKDVQISSDLRPGPGTKVTTTIKTFTYEIPNDTNVPENKNFSYKNEFYNSENSSRTYYPERDNPAPINTTNIYSSQSHNQTENTKFPLKPTELGPNQTYYYKKEVNETKNNIYGPPKSPQPIDKTASVYEHNETNDTRKIFHPPGGIPATNLPSHQPGTKQTYMYKKETNNTTNTVYAPPDDYAQPIPLKPSEPLTNKYYKYTSSTTTKNTHNRPDEREPLLAPFPTNGIPTNQVDGPPKNLNQLMATFEEDNVRGDDEPYVPRKEVNTALAEPKLPSRNVAGPPVYYPPGKELFAKSEAQAAWRAQGGYAKGSGKYEYEAESKSKSASKSGAAVVPVCLPLCCAMPCSIM